MIHCKLIVVPVDFSAPSFAAYEHACEYAEQFGAALHVLHVRHLNRDQAKFGGESAILEFDAFAKGTERQMAEFLGDKGAHCFPVTTVFRDGRAGEEIVRYAKDVDADLIVMGTHGHTGLMHMVLGSVAEEVVRTAACDVLTVHEADHGRYATTTRRAPVAG